MEAPEPHTPDGVPGGGAPAGIPVEGDDAVELPEPSDALSHWFGDRLPIARAYAKALAVGGVTRGLLGPREVPRLWERHVGNCAVVADLIPEGAHVVDVGSGAGLPGIALAVARPDLVVTLVEPMLRRTTFLQETVGGLGLTHVEVVRGRAEEVVGRVTGDVVVSRAVARLEVLAGWCLPLVRGGGEMLALKGSSAEEEVVAASDALGRLGVVETTVVECGRDILEAPTRVVRLRAGSVVPTPGRSTGRRAAPRSR